MVHIPARRGRPKGSGIDDADRLQRLAELLRVRPDLKPTTAIRLMGFSDPSAIRRLRDKYKAFSADARSTLGAVSNAAPAASKSADPNAGARAMTAN